MRLRYRTYALASRWSRVGASLIDALTIIPITLPLMYFTGAFENMSEGVQPSISYSLAITLVGIILFLMIHGYFLCRDGQTLGKKVLNIKIVTLDGHLPSIATLAKRYGFYWVVPSIPVIGGLLNLVNLLFIFSKSRRCIHDHFGGTKVVYVNT